MSAFGGKADMTICGCLLSRLLLGVKRTCFVALHMSASDPKRTLAPFLSKRKNCYHRDRSSLGGDNEAASIHQGHPWCSSGLAVKAARATNPIACCRIC